jgi:hypothetical protein
MQIVNQERALATLKITVTEHQVTTKTKRQPTLPFLEANTGA